MSYTSTYQAHLLDNLTAGQKAVITAIATFERAGKAWPSVKTLAKRASMGVRTVQRHLAALINLGYITRTYRAGHAAVTRLFIGQTTPPTPAKLAPPTPAKLAPNESGNFFESVNDSGTPPATPEHQHQHADTAAMPQFFIQTELPEQPKQPTPALPDLEHPPISTNEAIYKPVEPSKEVEGTDPPTGTNQATQDPVIKADPVEAAWAEVPAQLLADFGEVRRNKKKAAKVTRTEAQVLAQEAAKAGLSVKDLILLCVLRGWSFAKAEWLTHVPQQVQPGRDQVFKPETFTPASPSAIARFKESWAKQRAQILADSARRREEQMGRPARP